MISSNNPFMSNMWQWTGMQSPTGQCQDWLKNTQQQSQFLWFLGQQFSQLLENSSSKGNWQIALNEQFEQMKVVFRQWSANPSATLPFMPDIFQQDYLQTTAIASWFEKLLSIPGIGQQQKNYDKLRHGIKLSRDYQAVYSEFSREIGKINVSALTDMQNRILSISRQGKSFSSLREIYDLWVECAEKAYADYAYTEEHSKLYGRLSNSMLALQQHINVCMAPLLSTLNIPSREDMKTIVQRLQTMRRSHADAMDRIQKLEQQLQLVSQNKSAGENSPDSAAAKPRVVKKANPKTRKTAARKVTKKTAKKKTTNKE